MYIVFASDMILTRMSMYSRMMIALGGGGKTYCRDVNDDGAHLQWCGMQSYGKYVLAELIRLET